MKNTIFRWASGDNGATAIEYALIAAGISVAIAASVFLFGDKVYTLLYEDLPNFLN
jgi:Flp pilus assembly pilin Flp